MNTDFLEPGDILLSLGTGKTSIAIQMLDGGLYSHAALWTGRTLIESTTPCVAEHPLDESLAKHPRQHVHAYRYKGISRVRRLAVVDNAREYVGRRYSYGDLFLCAALMALLSAVPKPGRLKFLKEACEFSHFLSLDRPKEGEHVTCTQLIVRSYALAELPIRIQPKGAERFDVGAFVGAVGELAQSKDSEEAEWLSMRNALGARCDDLVADQEAIDEKGPLRNWDGRAPVHAEGEWRSNLVTPFNLEESVDLEFVGAVYPATGEVASRLV